MDEGCYEKQEIRLISGSLSWLEMEQRAHEKEMVGRRLIETITVYLILFSNMMVTWGSKQEATLDIHPSFVPRSVSSVVIRSCRSVIFHEAGFKHLSHLSIVTVEDVGEVVFHPGSFNQINVCK